jgi:hypothetical protein
MHASRPVVGIFAVVAAGTLISGVVGADTPVQATTTASLTIDPTCGDGHTTTITVSGNFVNGSGSPADNDDVDVYFDGVRETTAPLHLDGSGHLSPTRLPTTTEPADGSHLVTTVVITSVDPDPSSRVTGPRAQYVVPCAPPTLVDDPATVAYDSGGYSVQLSGENWGAGSSIALTFDGRSVGTGGADSDGAFSTTVQVSGGCGSHVFGASTDIGTGGHTRLRSASVGFTVIACTAPPGAPPGSPGAPGLAVSPDVVATGFLTTAHGHGYAPRAAVSFRWLLPNGEAVSARCAAAVAGPDGTFSTACLILPHDQLGGRQLLATQPGGGSATARCLVVANGFEPTLEGQLVDRR